MAKFYGKIGYALQEEKPPDSGIWVDTVTERDYRGDIILNQERWQPSDTVNDNLNLDNSISIIADEFAFMNIGNIKYIIWKGSKWKIQSLRANRPRIVLQIGGLYNGK